MPLTEQISQQLKEAMKARDEVRLRTLRSIRAEILKKEKEGKGAVTDDDVVTAIGRLVKQRKESIEQFEQAGRQDLVDIEQAELEILSEYLPEALSEAEIDRVIEEVFAQVAPSGAGDIGKVMGPLMGRLKKTGKSFDGGAVNARVREKLSA
jgi:hypothetical protein